MPCMKAKHTNGQCIRQCCLLRMRCPRDANCEEQSLPSSTIAINGAHARLWKQQQCSTSSPYRKAFWEQQSLLSGSSAVVAVRPECVQTIKELSVPDRSLWVFVCQNIMSKCVAFSLQCCEKRGDGDAELVHKILGVPQKRGRQRLCDI